MYFRKELPDTIKSIFSCLPIPLYFPQTSKSVAKTLAKSDEIL